MPRNDKKQRTVMRTQTALTVTASRSNNAPVFTVQPTGVVSFTQGNAGTADVSFTATDPNNDPITFALVGFPPAGVTYAFFTGFVRFSYTSGGTVGTSNLQISADDGHGNVTLSTQFTVTLAASSVSWTTIPDASFIPGEIRTVSVIGNLVNYSAATDVISVASGVVKPWCPFNGTGFGPSSGAQVDADDFGPIRLAVSRSSGTPAISNQFFVNVTAAPVVVDTWERLDPAASFNALPAMTFIQGPAFGGITTMPNGDIYFRDNAGDPHWNIFFKYATRTWFTTNSIDIRWDQTAATATPATGKGLTHNHTWCYDPDRNVMWSGLPSPAVAGWYGHMKYDLATNQVTNQWHIDRFVGMVPPEDPFPLDRPDGTGNEGMAGINNVMDYFDGSLYAFGSFGGDNSTVGSTPIKRRNLTTNFTGRTIETLFPGGGFGYSTPTAYAGQSPDGFGEYPYLIAGFDSRTGQAWTIDPGFDLWVNNTIPDGVARGWVKIPTFGPRPFGFSSSNPSYRRQACLHEALNCIVVIATEAHNLVSATAVLDLNTFFWRAGPSGNESPVVSNVGGPGVPSESHWYYAGALIYNRFLRKVFCVVPYSNHGTAVYELHVAGPTL